MSLAEPELPATDLPLRSWLFVPGDSARKLARGARSGADALILDLEDSVATQAKPVARQLVLQTLLARRRTRGEEGTASPDAPMHGPALWVRVNPVSGPDCLADLAVVAGEPDGIVLPKTISGADVLRLHHMLDVLESQAGIAAGQIRIVPVATETAASLFHMGSYTGCSARLAGLTWGAEDIATDLGATSNRLPGGRYDNVFELARSLCLVGARSAGVAAVDTIYADFRNGAALEAECTAARRVGFSGKLAIHPDQIATINQLFMPSEAEVTRARTIVALFESDPGRGTVALDGAMLDLPHLKQARQVLRSAMRTG